ncbi:MAG: AAA family ATPase [Ilumatobacteraceae bacterium]
MNETDPGQTDDQTEAVSAVETHISFVFMTATRAYKLLKPLRTGFLDHEDLDRRLAAVTREYELNRRLAPDVYLGTSDLHEHGQVTDRMLVMRRLPSARRLSNLVDDPEFLEHLRQIARTVAAFHASVDAIDESYTMASASGLMSLWASSFDDIEPSVGDVIERDEFERVNRLATEYLAHADELFEQRRRSGMVRDVHGDLTAGDIYVLDDGPRILDCIAFDDDYRISDVLADIAFLVMDVERLSGPAAAAALMRWYCEFSGEHHPGSLAHHYVAYRAHVRAKVALLRARQGDADASDLARSLHTQALDHLELGQRRMVLVGGGPGTGKSTLARMIADRLDWSVIDSDTLRKDLRGVDHDDHDVEQHPDLYDDATTDATYAQLCEHAAALLRAGESVVLDATWSDSAQRAAAHEVAQRHGAELSEIECQLDPETARHRIAERRRRERSASDATSDMVSAMAEHRHPWPAAARIDTSGPPDDVAAEAVRSIADRFPSRERFGSPPLTDPASASAS